MRNKGIIIGMAGIVVVAFALVSGCNAPKADKGAKKDSKPVAGAAAVKKEEPKKVISKDMGGLTVKIIDSKGKDLPVRVRAFKSSDARSSMYSASFGSNRMQELAPGSYDIEIDTVPQKMYKNINVQKGKETVESLGCATGALIVKAMDSQNKEGRYSVRVFYPGTNTVVAAGVCGRPMEIIGGMYDVEVGTMPKQVKKGAVIETGKDMLVNFAMSMGSLIVKTTDENGSQIKLSARISKAGNNEPLVSIATNRAVDLVGGSYIVEVLSKAGPVKKDANIAVGGTTTLDVMIATPAPAAPVATVVPVKAPAKAPSKTNGKK
jgi:hypothetical protein